jgi:hypothetical protein
VINLAARSKCPEPQMAIARFIDKAIKAPLAYLYCDEYELAQIILAASELPAEDQEHLLKSLKECLALIRSTEPSE